MNTIFHSLLVWGIALATIACAQGDQALERLDLNACYQRALERNERIGLASAEWRAAEARYRQVRDTLFPAVSVGGDAGFQNDRRTGGTDSAARSPEYYVARLHAEQVIYQGFRLTREAEAGEALGRAAQLDERRVRELLYLDVADAFHQVLLNEDDGVVLDQLVDALQKTVTELERRVILGRSRKAELLQAQTALAEAKVEQETALGNVALARELLGFLMDLPANDWQLVGISPLPSTPELESKLVKAAERADILAGTARAEAARKTLQAAQGARQPEVKAEGNYLLYEDPDEDREWNIQLTFSLPVFDEGVRRAAVREQAEQLHISELNLDSLRRQAASEVRHAYLSFLSTVAQRARLQEALEVARVSYQEQKRDYALGRANQLDELAALAQVQRLTRRAVATDMQARISLVRLHVAAGEATP